MELADDFNGYINFLGFANVMLDNIEFMVELIKDVDFLYFSIGDNSKEYYISDLNNWINDKISNNKVVLFFLDGLWGESNELVAIRKDDGALQLTL